MERTVKDFAYYQKRAAELLQRDWKMLVNGEMVTSAAGKTMETYNPATGEVIGKVPFADRDDVYRTVAAAEEAFQSWRKVPVNERVRYIHKMIDVLQTHRDDLALLDALNSGNPIRAMMGDIDLAINTLEMYAGSAFEVKGSTFPSTTENLHIVIREPYGVVGRIIPFNHPLMFTVTKIAAPVLMGNTLVLKVPDQAPIPCLYFAELIKDVFPPGVVNIISGDGAETGDAIVRHPNIKRISLIGSVGTGQRILKSAAETGIKHVSLELGGKNPMIVFPDADLERAAAAAVAGMNFTVSQGQSCGSVSRLFLHEDIHDRFVEKVVERASKIKLGNPIDPNTEMGCLISKAQFEKVKSYIGYGKEDGARLVCGGSPSDDPALKNGYFIPPTVFVDVNCDMRIAKEEIFGPVLSVIKWREEEEVLRLANSTEYGLTGAVWTNNVNTAVRVAKAIESGVIWINGVSAHFLGMPFTGRKNSGLDSEESLEELESYTQLKTINFVVH